MLYPGITVSFMLIMFRYQDLLLGTTNVKFLSIPYRKNILWAVELPVLWTLRKAMWWWTFSGWSGVPIIRNTWDLVKMFEWTLQVRPMLLLHIVITTAKRRRYKMYLKHIMSEYISSPFKDCFNNQIPVWSTRVICILQEKFPWLFFFG